MAGIPVRAKQDSVSLFELDTITLYSHVRIFADTASYTIYILHL